MAAPIDRFYDSDEEDNQIYIEQPENDYIAIRAQERTNPVIEQFAVFLNNPALIMPKDNPSTRFINLHTGIPYDIPTSKLNRFFDYMERIRRMKTIGLKWEERQYFENSQMENNIMQSKLGRYSGIMIDMDIYQEGATNQFDSRMYNLLTQHISQSLKQYICIEEHQEDNAIKIHIAIMRRPKITQCRELDENIYKDGIHILIPSVQLSKPAKRLFIHKFCNPEADIFRLLKIVKAVNQISLDDRTGVRGHNCIDLASATVPVFLYGSERRNNHASYVFDKFIELNYSVFDDRISDAMIRDITDKYTYFDNNTDKATSIWVQELSLHWEVGQDAKTPPIIRKRPYEIRREYIYELKEYGNERDQNVDPSIYGELDIRRINDTNTDFYQGLLDTLSPKRYEQYDMWFDVLCVLAHAKGDCKSLAKYFSQKSAKKYNAVEFEKYWMQAKKSRRNTLNIGSLCFWAKQDNPNRYEEVCKHNVHKNLIRRIFDGTTDGLLGHFDVASILHDCVPYKYIYSSEAGGHWYECITENDDHREGELFKWREVCGIPASMRNYISVVMPIVFGRALNTINDTYTRSKDMVQSKFYFSVMTNFKNTCRKLKDSGFKNAVVRDAQDLYSDFTFSDKLDKEQSVLPVKNGILILGKNIKLLNGYNNLYISKYAPTNYMAFDPRHPLIKKVLKLYRDLFPDNQPDTHEFFMSLYASSLDARPKDQIFCIKVGGGKNGKTMTTEIHRNMMGHEFAITLPMQFITGNNKRDAESSTPATMRAEYARHVDYQESDKCETLASAKMKLITGGGTIGGRENYGSYRNFRLNCNHVMDTNYLPKINDNSHGVWRRVKVIEMPMRFHDKHEMADFDEKNPYHRIAENVDTLKDDPEFLAADLAVKTWYYEQLHLKYGGSIQNIPHPNIKQKTINYRNTQNKLSLFYTKYLIKCNNEERDNKLLLDDIRARYERWFKTVGVVDKEFLDSLDWEINNSIIANLIQKDPYGPCDYIRGFRLREFNDIDELKDGERLFETPSYKMDNDDIKIKIKPENWETYYLRICAEYDAAMEAKRAGLIQDDAIPVGATHLATKEPFITSTLKDIDIDGYSTITELIDKKNIDKMISTYTLDNKLMHEINNMRENTEAVNNDAADDDAANNDAADDDAANDDDYSTEEEEDDDTAESETSDFE